MDQAVFENNINKMKHRIEEGDIKKAIYIADKIDWAEVKDVNLLVYVSMIYEQFKDYDSAKVLLEYAYEVAPIKNRLFFALCNINIKLGDMKRAQDFYIDFCDTFPLDNKKILLQYYFLKKKGADAVQKCRILEEYLQEEKNEELMFELAVLYEELGEKQKVVSTCEYIVNFFGMKKNGYGRKALELKKKYEELTIKEEELINNYLKENEIDEETNIVYQTISHPNLKIVEEKDNNDKIEKIKRDKKITEEELFKSKDDNMAQTIKYEPETIESLRDKEMNMAFMNKNKKNNSSEEKNKQINNIFEKYRSKSFKRKERDMKLEDLKQHMIIEAYSRNEAFEIATEELNYLHKALGNQKKVAKANGYNINERGFSYYIDKLGDRDLIIESAGQLKNQVLDEIEEYLINNGNKNIIVLCDLINNFDRIANERTSFVARFDVYSVLSENNQELLDDEKDIKKTFEKANSINNELIQNIKNDLEKEIDKKIEEKIDNKDMPIIRKVESSFDSEKSVDDEYLKKQEELKKIEEEKLKKQEEMKKLEEQKLREEIEAKLREEELKKQEEQRIKEEIEKKLQLEKEELKKQEEEKKKLEEELRIKIELEKQENLKKLEEEQRIKEEIEKKLQLEKEELKRQEEEKKKLEEELRQKAELEKQEELKKLEEEQKIKEEIEKKLQLEKEELKKREEKQKEEDELKEEKEEKVSEKHKTKDMNVDEFVEFCKSYAKSIDCNMPGKTIPALYERIEMMVEEGLSLTEKRAIELIESAADKAEKPRFFFKPKYDKDGNLILQEEHFIG